MNDARPLTPMVTSKVILAMFVLLALPTPFFLYSTGWSLAQNLLHHLFKVVPIALLYIFTAKTIIARRRGDVREVV